MRQSLLSSINGVVVTWVVAISWRAASTRRGFDSPLMQFFVFLAFFNIFTVEVHSDTALYSKDVNIRYRAPSISRIELFRVSEMVKNSCSCPIFE